MSVVFFNVMLIVVKLNATMMNIAMLIVVRLNVAMMNFSIELNANTLSVLRVNVVVPFSLPETEKKVLKIACLAHKLRCYKTF